MPSHPNTGQRMTQLTVLMLFTLVLTLAAARSASAAEVRLATYVKNADSLVTHGLDTKAENQPVRIWFDAQHARRDVGWLSFSLDREAEQLLIIDHFGQRYQVVPLPLDLVSLVRPVLQEDFADLLPSRVLRGRLQAATRQQAVGPWQATATSFELTSERGERRDLDVWLSQDIAAEADLTAVYDLMQAISLMRIRDAGWWNVVRQRQGFPVRVYEQYHLPMTTAETDETLRSVRTIEAGEADLFAAPEGYHQVNEVFEVGSLL